jgi:hypothetical protein
MYMNETYEEAQRQATLERFARMDELNREMTERRFARLEKLKKELEAWNRKETAKRIARVEQLRRDDAWRTLAAGKKPQPKPQPKPKEPKSVVLERRCYAGSTCELG